MLLAYPLVGRVNLRMHIAHSKRGNFLSVGQIAKLTGLKRRQIAILARQRRIPGARLSANGYHYEYPVSEELRDWIKRNALRVQKRKKPKEFKEKEGPHQGIVTVQGIYMAFEIWQRRFATGHYPFEKWPSADLNALLLELVPIAHLCTKINRILNSRQ